MIKSILILFMLVSTASADMVRVTLRGTARVAAGSPVTLADVASVQGGDLAGSTVVVSAADAASRDRASWVEVTAEDVIAAIGLPKARIAVRGTLCRVRMMEAAPAPVFVRTSRGQLVESFDGPILRDHIRERVRSDLGVADEDLRLEFAPKDATLVRTATAGRTVEVQPLGSSADMPIAVTIYDGERIVLSESIRVSVEVRKTVLVADRPIEKRGTIEPQDFRPEERWVDPTLALAGSNDMEGATARANLDPGETIELRHVQPPIVVERGDQVTVRCVMGTIVAKISARALDEGRDGDRIRFEPVNGGRRFHATINGPGRAVLATPGVEEKSE